jgi:hypothetical protein
MGRGRGKGRGRSRTRVWLGLGAERRTDAMVRALLGDRAHDCDAIGRLAEGRVGVGVGVGV